MTIGYGRTESLPEINGLLQLLNRDAAELVTNAALNVANMSFENAPLEEEGSTDPDDIPLNGRRTAIQSPSSSDGKRRRMCSPISRGEDSDEESVHLTESVKKIQRQPGVTVEVPALMSGSRQSPPREHLDVFDIPSSPEASPLRSPILRSKISRAAPGSISPDLQELPTRESPATPGRSLYGSQDCPVEIKSESESESESQVLRRPYTSAEGDRRKREKEVEIQGQRAASHSSKPLSAEHKKEHKERTKPGKDGRTQKRKRKEMKKCKGDREARKCLSSNIVPNPGTLSSRNSSQSTMIRFSQEPPTLPVSQGESIALLHRQAQIEAASRCDNEVRSSAPISRKAPGPVQRAPQSLGTNNVTSQALNPKCGTDKNPDPKKCDPHRAIMPSSSSSSSTLSASTWRRRSWSRHSRSPSGETSYMLWGTMRMRTRWDDDERTVIDADSDLDIVDVPRPRRWGVGAGAGQPQAGKQRG